MDELTDGKIIVDQVREWHTSGVDAYRESVL
jgi:hypothetical protein